MCEPDRAALDAAGDRLLDAKLANFAVEIQNMVARGDITEPDSAVIVCSAVASLILAYVECFPPEMRAQLAASLLCDINSMVLQAHEIVGGAREPLH